MKGEAGADRGQSAARPGWGTRLRRGCVFVYLIRFPIIAAICLVLVPYLSGEGRALDALVGGAFELSDIGTIYVMLGGFTLAWTILVTTRIIWLYGRFRFVELAVAEAVAARAKPGFIRRWWLAAMDCERWTGHVLAALLVLPLLSRVVAVNTALPWLSGFDWWSTLARLLACSVVGGLISIALLWLAELGHRYLRPPSDSAETSARFLLLPPHAAGLLSKVEAKVDRENPAKDSAVYRWSTRLFSRAALWLGPGYRQEGEEPPRLLAGHPLALALLVVSLWLYALLGVPQAFHQTNLAPSSLGYLFAIGILLTWALAGLSFFLDRLRVPVALPILVWFYLMTWVPSNEHHFTIVPRDPGLPRAPSAAEVVGDRDSIIVVAAGGGGIRAAAWAARVLIGLDELSRKDPELRRRGIRFAPNVRMLSGVSGGSLAILNFACEYEAKHGGWVSDRVAVVDLSERTSLDPLVWGLVYPDFGRALLPMFVSPTRNRGGELESRWAYRMKKAGLDPKSGLATWRTRTAGGEVPALIFNSTDAETGERIITGTTALGTKPQRGRVRFDDLYQSQFDLAPVTAVRMSATFPYVTPAAKPSSKPPARGDTSWVDGGYSDNYGMASVLDWVQEALGTPNSRLRRVMVVQIQAGPDPLTKAAIAEAGRGLYYQLGIPLEAMLSVWNSGQAVRNDTQFAMIQVAWQYNRGSEGYAIQTAYCALKIPPDPDGTAPTLPLSWHLTARQKQQLDDAWIRMAADQYGPWPKIRSFLLGEKPE